VIISLLLVLIGAVFEGLPAMLVFAPLLMPAAQALGISGVHFGIVLIIAASVGVMAPPLGVGYYIACGVAGSSPGRTMRSTIPYVAILVVGLLVVALFPEVTLLVPRALNLPVQ
jgi:TRAP-type C4-dicarboxylate transport system permease large subunit